MRRFMGVIAAAAVALAVLGIAGIQGTGHQSPAAQVASGSAIDAGNGGLAWM